MTTNIGDLVTKWALDAGPVLDSLGSMSSNLGRLSKRLSETELELKSGKQAAELYAAGYHLASEAHRGFIDTQIRTIANLREQKRAIEELSAAQARSTEQMHAVRSNRNGPGYSDYSFATDSRPLAVTQGAVSILQQRTEAEAARAGKTSVQRINEANAAAHAARQAGYDQMAADLAKEDALLAERVKNDPVLRMMNNKDDSFQAGLRRMKVMEAEGLSEEARRRAVGVAGDRWREEDAADKERLDTIRRSTLAISNARREETEQDRAALNTLREQSRQRAQWRRDDANVMRQLNEQGYFERNKTSNRNAAPGQGATSNANAWALAGGFRTIEDFAQGSVYGGVRGGIIAASNNVSQIGASYGALGVVIGAVASTALTFGVIVSESWKKSAEGANQATDAVKNYGERLSETASHAQRLFDVEMERRNLSRLDLSGADAMKDRLSDQIDRVRNDIGVKEKLTQRTLEGVGAGGISSDELREWVRERTQRRAAFTGQQLPMAGMVAPDAATLNRRDMTPWESRMLSLQQANPSVFDPKFIKELEAAEKDLNKERDIEQKLVRQLTSENEANRQRLQRNADADAEREIELGSKRREAIAQRGSSARIDEDITDLDRMAGAERRRQERQNRQNQLRRSGNDWRVQRDETLLLAGMQTDTERAAYQAQKEYETSLRLSAKAESVGVLTNQDRLAMDLKSQEKRDRDIRLAKYGNMPVDGGTGFSGADFRSSAGVNNVLRGITYAGQDKAVAELKKNGEISIEVRDAVRNVATVMQHAVVPVEDFR